MTQEQLKAKCFDISESLASLRTKESVKKLINLDRQLQELQTNDEDAKEFIKLSIEYQKTLKELADLINKEKINNKK